MSVFFQPHLCLFLCVCVCVCTLQCSVPPINTHSQTRTHTCSCVCTHNRAVEQGQGSLFNGRDRGPWGLSSPQLEALEERLGAVLLIQVGLIMPVHPLPLTLPPLHQIWEETHDKGRQAGGGRKECVCAYNLWPSPQSSMGSGDLRDFASILHMLFCGFGARPFCCSTSTPQPALLKLH